MNVDSITADKPDIRANKIEIGNKRLSDQEQMLEKLNKTCFREIISIQNKLEADKNALAEQQDFTVEGAFSLFSASPI